jgi:23S rRNA (adenine2503-C2)-methyltransferase
MAISILELKHHVCSQQDKTQKFLFTTDGMTLEVSYIDKGDGKDILCVPTQSGCNQGCLFCHMTGSNIPVQNLPAGAIVAAVQLVRHQLNLTGEKPLLISYMGCGEPLRNTSNLRMSMKQLQQDIPQVRFALATIMPQRCEAEWIELGKFVKELGIDLKIHLSLHFVEDEVRERWLPKAGKIAPSLHLLNWYRDFTGNKIEIHYAPIKGFNDTFEDALALSWLIGRTKTSNKTVVKLLQFNQKPGLAVEASPHLEDFESDLSVYGINTERYTPPGRDIGASCGQFDLDAYRDWSL